MALLLFLNWDVVAGVGAPWALHEVFLGTNSFIEQDMGANEVRSLKSLHEHEAMHRERIATGLPFDDPVDETCLSSHRRASSTLHLPL